jgi:hypothetical protein
LSVSIHIRAYACFLAIFIGFAGVPTRARGLQGHSNCNVLLAGDLPKYDQRLIPKGLLAETRGHIGHAFSDLLHWQVHDRPVPSSRAMTVELGRRYQTNDDDHVVGLLSLGGRVVTVWDRPAIRLPTIGDFTRNYHQAMTNFVRAKIIGPDDILWPSKLYSNITEFNPDGDYQAFRIGIDPVILDRSYIIKLPGTEIPHLVWSKFHSQGQAVFQVPMADHDFGHFTEYRRFPLKMAATKAFYRATESGQIGQKVVRTVFDIRNERAAIDQVQGFVRIFVGEEVLSLPNLRRSDEIRNLIPEVFASRPRNLAERRKQLDLDRQENLTAFIRRARRIAMSAESLLLRVGGGMRDPYNLKRHGYEDHYPNYVSDNPPAPDHEKIVYSLFRETLHVKIKLLKDALASLESFSRNADRVALIASYIVHNLGALEMGLYTGVTLGLTSDQIIRDITHRQVPQDSPTAQYFRAFTDRGQLVHWAFLEPDQPFRN